MNSKQILWLVVILVVLIAIAYGFMAMKNDSIETPIDEEGSMVACTMDAMMCPDGSYVGRTGPKCEFVCPSATSTTSDSQNSPVTNTNNTSYPADLAK